MNYINIDIFWYLIIYLTKMASSFSASFQVNHIIDIQIKHAFTGFEHKICFTHCMHIHGILYLTG